MAAASVCVFLCLVIPCVAQTFRFSSYHHDHMVLQKGVNKQQVWGISEKHFDTVHLTLTQNGGAPQNVGVGRVENNGIWMIKINYTIGNDYGPYNITATSSLGSVTLHDVMFGDVWVCSGQSNMEFQVSGLTNRTEELNDAQNYQNIRLFKAAHNMSITLLNEFHLIWQNWTPPNQGVLSGFSAVCWLYGKALYQHFGYPIGLVETNWGGTAIEVWSSPDAMKVCSTRRKRDDFPRSPSLLWNAMVGPLLRSSIYGAIWYQGEANAYESDLYACMFPAMIADWRKKFNMASQQGTSQDFPFGFVQLAPFRQDAKDLGFSTIRWSQTANVGEVPNVVMPNTFMAVAMDLPDFASPWGSIHPRYKHDVAARLVLGALAVAYNQKGIDFQGPYPSSFTPGQNTLLIEYSNGREPLDVRSDQGFEICCSNVVHICPKNSGTWRKTNITSHDTSSVTLDASPCNGHGPVRAVRYAWRESPCDFKLCAVYGRDNDLPGPPFYQEI